MQGRISLFGEQLENSEEFKDHTETKAEEHVRYSPRLASRNWVDAAASTEFQRLKRLKSEVNG